MRKLTDDSITDEQVLADPRKLNGGITGTPLRDAAVDPKHTDFLAPTNAGEANPHGPDVVNPEIHASQGVRPIKPDDVHVDDTDAQDAAETEHAVQVQEGGVGVEKPAGNASRDDWVAYAIADGQQPGSLEELSRDEIRAIYPATTQ